MSKARIPDKLGATSVASAFFQFRRGTASINRASESFGKSERVSRVRTEVRNSVIAPSYSRKARATSALSITVLLGRVRPVHPPFEGASI